MFRAIDSGETPQPGRILAGSFTPPIVTDPFATTVPPVPSPGTPITGPAWVVDPIAGNDTTGTGLPGSPVKTAARLYAIWTGLSNGKPTMSPTGGIATVTFTSAPPLTDHIGILANVICLSNSPVVVQAPAATVATTDTILAIVHSLNRGQGTAQPWVITGTGTANFTPFVNSLFVDTTLGTVAWIGNTGAGGVTEAELTQVCTALAGPSFFQIPAPVAPVGGNAFQVLTLPQASFGANPICEGPDSFGGVVFHRWHFADATFLTQVITTSGSASIAFAECRVATTFEVRGNVYGLNSFYSAGGLQLDGNFKTSTTTPAVLAGGSGVAVRIANGCIDGDFYFRDIQFNGNQGSLNVFGPATLGLVGFFQRSGLQQNSIYVRSSGNVSQEAVFYGGTAVYGIINQTPPNVGRCVACEPGGTYQYPAPATTAIGFSAATRIACGNNPDVRDPALVEQTGGYSVADLGTTTTIFDSATGAFLAPKILLPVGSNTILNVIGGAGIFGDGSDGAALFSNPVGPVPAGAVQDSAIPPVFHLTRDVHYTSCNIENGVVVNTRGFKIRCTGQFIAIITGATLIQNNGGDGANGAVGGAAGAAGLTGTVAGGTAGGAGGGPATPGAAGTNVTQGVPTAPSAAAGGAGGAGGAAGGAAGTWTAVASGGVPRGQPELGLWAVPSFTGIALALLGLQGGAGGGGGGGGASTGGGGGGGGGTVWIAARVIVGTGAVIAAKGGAGGVGDAGAGGQGGGGGGGGGTVVLISPQIVEVTTSVVGGAGGAGGGGGAAGAGGTAGNTFRFRLAA